MRIDVLVIGGGGAGVAAASAAAEAGARVLLASKEPASVGDTRISTGVVAVPGLAPGDDDAALTADLHRSGAGLARAPLVEALVEEARDAFEWLRASGLRPDRTAAGGPRTLPAPMGGHSYARSVPTPGRGVALGQSLADRLDRLPGLVVRDDAWATELIVDRGRVQGAWLRDARTGRHAAVRARAVVLATGGIGTLFWPHTDTMRTNTGDGHALALAAGAALVDMEQVQFTPFGRALPPVGLPLGEAVLAGPAGVLRGTDGAILARDLDHLPRAALAGRIAEAVASCHGTEAGGVFLDVSANDDAWRAAFRRDWGHVLRVIRRGLDVPWEVAPTAHYHMGGVEADARGATDVPGLYVAGQLLGGLHGANRLGSTSIPALVVFGRRAGRAAAAAPAPTARPGPAPPLRRASDAIPRLRALQEAAWTGAGPARTAAGLAALREAARAERARLERDPPATPAAWDVGVLAWLELRSLATVAEAVATAGLARRASLGAHLRLDGAGAPARASTRITACSPLPDAAPPVGWLPAGSGAVPVTVLTSDGPVTARVPDAPTALDALLHLRETALPDLAFRYGCRSARCGTCAVEIDGRPRLACRDRVRAGQTVGPLRTLPRVRDLVVDRRAPDARLRGRLPPLPSPPAPADARARRLEACIACLACLDGCPLHAEGRGDPMSFLRLALARTAGADVTDVARSLGIDRCVDCHACRCGVGIRLDRDVLAPLAAATAESPR